MPKTKSPKAKKTLHKTVKKSDLEAFTKGQNYLDMMEEESSSHGQKMLSMLIEGKKSAKEEIFCNFENTTKPCDKKDLKTALVLVFATDLNGQTELFPRENLFRLLEGLMVLNMKIVVIDTQQPSDLNNLGELGVVKNGQIVWYNPEQDNSGRAREEKEIDRLLLASDLAIIFHHHNDLVKLLMNYGVVIVADESSPQLENYKPNEETGNAFLFNKRDLWSVFASVVRAMETFKFPYDWQHIVRKLFR
jgi:hypothetical protein